MTQIRWYGPTIVLLVAVLLALLAGPRLATNIVFAQERAKITLASQSLAQSELLTEFSEAFRNVAEAVRPSVVSIQAYATQPQNSHGQTRPRDLRDFLNPDRTDDLYDRFRYHRPDRGEREEEYDDGPIIVGTGSGWVYDEQGHIITNSHVVTVEMSNGTRMEVDRIEVHFPNGDNREAKIVGLDQDTDIAVLQVDGDHLHPAKIANQPAEQGEIVFAFGSPLQFEFSMSQGIVSAKNRELNIIQRPSRRGLVGGYENFIQTDAAINQGNSGGPLTNLFGEVVGMNTSIATNRFDRGSIGLGFAIPVDMIRDVAEAILTEGRVERGWLGIEYRSLSAEEAETFDYDTKAVVVWNVLKDGPAERGGIQRGDVIMAIDGTPIQVGSHLRKLIAKIKPGSNVRIEVSRAGQKTELQVLLGDKSRDLGFIKSQRSQSTESDDDSAAKLLRKLGLEATQVFTEDIARRFNIEFTPGVLVRKIRSGSPADRQGMEVGQIITHVMGAPINDTSELANALKGHESRSVVRISIINRRGRQDFILLKMR